MNMVIENIIKEFKEKVKKSYNAYKISINKLNLGIATPLIIQNVKINYYNEQISLNKISLITVKDNKTLKVTLFDKNILDLVNKTILKENLNLNTVKKSENIIYIKLPILNINNKIMIKKIILKKTDEFKNSIRNQRRNFNINIQKKFIKKIINKDQLYFYKNKIQKYTDIYINKISLFHSEIINLLNK